MSRTLYSRPIDPKWTVLKSRVWDRWHVFPPRESGPRRDFSTHAEAIAHADTQARKES